MKIAYFDCFSGISGDMTLGALVDLGLSPELLESELAKLRLVGYRLCFTKTQRHGISGTKAHVELTDKDNTNHHGRHLEDIRLLVRDSELSENVKAKSERIFTRLGEVEARIHNVPLEDVHFHEVGAIDSIIDIVGSVIGITALGIDKIYSSPLSLGKGFAMSSHGIIPVPAPATLELLKGIPVRQTDIHSELTTPTGAAIISTLADSFGPMPEIVIDKIGYGAGTKDLSEQPNMLRVILGTTKQNYEQDTIIAVETNIDDMPPNIYDLLMDKLFRIGALDVFLTPIVMKKNRPAVKLTVLTDPVRLQPVCDCILTETTTMGVRMYEASRKKLSREIVEVDTEYGKVKVKLGKVGDDIIKILPEYEDCKRLAMENNVPVMKVHQAVFSAFFSH